jgi:hypothetical protein
MLYRIERQLRLMVGAGALLCFWACSAFAIDEAVTGDISSAPTAPTPVTLVLGSNTMKGSVNGSGDADDYITFTIPAGQRLTNLKLQSWGTNRGFHAINSGATSFIPSTTTAASFLGGNHVDSAPAGTDLLPALGSSPIAGSGFSVPLGPGTYTYLVQQTSAILTNYEFTLVIGATPPAVPVMGPAILMITACLIAICGVVALRKNRTKAA